MDDQPGAPQVGTRRHPRPKKVLGRMRLTGMRTSTLRSIILREAAIPLLAVLLIF
jgi:hypothetical protein